MHYLSTLAPFVARIGRVLAMALGLLLVLGGAGSVYESIAEANDARAYPAPGRMIDVGGYRLHLNCVGAGSPTVVIEAALGDSSLSWSSSVQPAAGRTTRVCTYDRAGMGYSDPGPLPRTAERFVEELHTVLLRADEPGPYVLVGHSLGGLPVRVFAHKYPTEMVGVVLVDSMSPSSAGPSGSGHTEQSDASSVEGWLLALPTRTGLMRLLVGPLQLTADSYTPRAQHTLLEEGKGLPDSLAQAGAVKTFGGLALIVLSRGLRSGNDEKW
jgi:pimeloyl-ACP methyl ester carboxylesterase